MELEKRSGQFEQKVEKKKKVISYRAETGAKEQYRLFLLNHLINEMPFLAKRYL